MIGAPAAFALCGQCISRNVNFQKSLWTNYAIQVNLRGIREIIVDKRAYLK